VKAKHDSKKKNWEKEGGFTFFEGTRKKKG
jgi:hypothetical protein